VSDQLHAQRASDMHRVGPSYVILETLHVSVGICPQNWCCSRTLCM